MINKIKKGLLVGLGAFTWSRKKAKNKVKKFYSIGKRNEEKGEYIIDQILKGIGEDRKSVKRTIKRAAKRAVKKAKPKARTIIRKAARRAKPLTRRVAKKIARPKRKARRKAGKSRKTRKRR
jgi:polyhydroxyalkanoate synthesis regulator phasin|tara:strand:- start:19199 stop:19564 length:366 start_codon:yes stop_codon:yes gene_type:complete